MQWALNPIALADVIVGATTNPGDWNAVQAVLREAFQYRQNVAAVFDADSSPPEQMRVFTAIANAYRNPQKLEDVLKLPAVRKLTRYYTPDQIARVLPLVVPIIGEAVRSGAPGRAHHVESWNDVDAITPDSISWKDPIQGAIADCYLIASMIALAWSQPEAWRSRLEAASTRRKGTGLTFELYRGPSEPLAPTHVTLRLPFSKDGRPVFARSSQPAEAWPGLVEKAFVMQIRRSTGEPTVADYGSIGRNGHYPQFAARKLAGGRARNQVAVAGSGGLANVVSGWCDSRGVTRVPMMAWCGEKENARKGSPGWAETGLFHHHTYAVLGVMTKKAGEYVVLRNPYGCSVHRDRYAAGVWKPGKGPHGDPEVFLDLNGVSAIPVDWFNDVMTNVGWVEPAMGKHAAPRKLARSSRRK